MSTNKSRCAAKSLTLPSGHKISFGTHRVWAFTDTGWQRVSHVSQLEDMPYSLLRTTTRNWTPDDVPPGFFFDMSPEGLPADVPLLERFAAAATDPVVRRELFEATLLAASGSADLLNDGWLDSPLAPPLLLSAAASKKSPWRHKASAAWNPATPSIALTRLATDVSTPQNRREWADLMLARPDLDPEIVAETVATDVEMLKDGTLNVRTSCMNMALRRDDLPAYLVDEIQDMLLERPMLEAHFAASPSVSAERLSEFLAGKVSPSAMVAAAENPNLSADDAKTLMHEDDPMVPAAIVGKAGHLVPGSAELAATSSQTFLRMAAAMSADLNEGTAVNLLADSSRQVRFNALENPKTPTSLIGALAQETEDLGLKTTAATHYVRRIAPSVGHPSSAQLFDHMALLSPAGTAEAYVRLPDTAWTLLSLAASDPASDVSTHLARHPHVPEFVIADLVSSRDLEDAVVKELDKNPAVPAKYRRPHPNLLAADLVSIDNPAARRAAAAAAASFEGTVEELVAAAHHPA